MVDYLWKKVGRCTIEKVSNDIDYCFWETRDSEKTFDTHEAEHPNATK